VSGEPLAGVTVSARGAGRNYATTDENGAFSFRLAPGEITMTVSSTASHVETSKTVTVPEEGVPDLVIAVDRGYSLSGLVRSANLDVPLAGIDVSVRSTNGDVSEWADTDREGEYITPALPPGEYVIEFRNWLG